MNEEELELIKIINSARAHKKSISVETDILKKEKEWIRHFFVDSGITEKIEGVSVVRAFSSLDIELLRLEHPKLFERYCIREEHTITTFDNIISKEKLKLIQKEHPEIWKDKDYRKELTPRLKGL